MSRNGFEEYLTQKEPIHHPPTTAVKDFGIATAYIARSPYKYVLKIKEYVHRQGLKDTTNTT